MSDANTGLHDQLARLERQIADLRATAVPSTQLIDALNAQAQLLSSINIERALSVSREAHTLAFLLRHHMGMAVSLARLSWLHLEAGAFDTAVMEAHQAQYLAKQLSDYVLTMRSAYVLATANRMAGNYAKAAVHWHQSIDMARAHNDALREADCQSSLGEVFEDQNDFARALAQYQSAHALYAAAGDLAHITAKNNVAVMMTKLGRNAEARDLAQQALFACDPSQSVWQTSILHTLGVAYMNLAQHDVARRNFEASLGRSLEPAGRKTTAVKSLIDLARLELLAARMPQAFDLLERAATLSAEINAIALQADVHKMLFGLYLTAHELTSADAHHERYLELKQKLELDRMDKYVGLIRAEAEAERQQPIWAQEMSEFGR